jgi:hypothetical protein
MTTLETQIAELEAALEKMTAAPWAMREDSVARIIGPGGEVIASDETYYPTAPTPDDMVGIALSRNLLPALIADWLRLRERVAQLGGNLDV